MDMRGRAKNEKVFFNCDMLYACLYRVQQASRTNRRRGL